MTDEDILTRVKWWLVAVPLYLAYRLIWLAAKTGQSDARDVYRSIWAAQIDLPPIEGLSND